MDKDNEEFEKIRRIIRVLFTNPDGIWLRKLSRESKMPLSTIHYYLERKIQFLVENVGAKNEEGHFFGIRIIRLKSGVFNQLSKGNFNSNLRRILSTNRILSDLD